MQKKLVIEISYGGMGDHLFHSHLPRIAKEFGGYEKVYISNNSLFRHPDNKKLIWELNPFVDGFVEGSGKTCDIVGIVNKVSRLKKTELNLLDEIMLAFGLDDGLRGHEPEIYYQPKRVKEYQKTIFDPNHLSCVGAVNSKYMMSFLKKKKIQFEAIMKLRNDIALYETQQGDEFINTPTLFDFCDLIHSSKKLYCLTSGTATLAAALKKPAVVFYGELQPKAYQHSSYHTYQMVERSVLNKMLDTLKVPYRRMKTKIKK